MGVEGPASLSFISGSAISSGIIFLFLLVLATGEDVDPFVSFSSMEEAALKRVDLLEDIVRLRCRRRLFPANLAALGLRFEGRKSRRCKILIAVFERSMGSQTVMLLWTYRVKRDANSNP